MKKTTRLSAVALSAIAALSLSACTAEEAPSNDGGDATKTVWYADVMDANPTATAIAQGMNQTLAENGIEMTRSLAIDTTTGNIDLGAQAQGLTRAIAAKPDAIAYFLLDASASRPQVEEAMGQGIPVFAAFGKPDFDVNAYIALYDEDQGYVSASYLAENLQKGDKVAILGGPANQNVLNAEAGATKALEEAGMTIVGDVEQQRNLTDGAAGGKEVMQGILQQNPDVKGVWVYNDDSAMGAIAAAKQAGADVLFTSRNGTADAIAAVKAGDLLGTCDIQPAELGKSLGQAIADQINGVKEYKDSERIPSPPAEDCMVTKDNVDDWKAPEDLITYAEIPLG
ncbi:MAG: sugar ABC transporter substrate-binding protein [Microbacterium sp.]|uniref:sugar ABC transporter substrate-binding protein n=1 Tax=Microbacterium sp. TaxID=51671 RepID=UPI0039E54131